MLSLGIDIGTTTISIVIVDRKNGELKAARTIPNGSFLESEYFWEKKQDPAVIISKIEEAIEETLVKYKDISVIGLTGQMHGIVYLNREGKHISPLYTWQDGSGALECFSGKSICQILQEKYGIKGNTGYGLITYLYHCRTGQVPQGAAQICTIMDYLGMVLTEKKKPLVHSSNAASFGLYDTKKKRFLKEILEAAGGDSKILPEISDKFVIQGSFRGIPVGIAIGDNQASFLGSVPDAEDSILVNMGTGGQISVLSDIYFEAPGIEARPFTEEKYLLAGSSLCGGRAYALLKAFYEAYAQAMGVTNVDHYAVMAKLLEEYPKDKIGQLHVRTTFSGTREAPQKKGKIEGIGVDNFHPAALNYGVLDGMAQELYDLYVIIAEGTKITRGRMIASGNGIRRNPFLQEILRDKFSMEINMAKYQEEAAYGAAKAGMLAGGK